MIRPLNVALPISSFLPDLGGMEVGLHNIALRLVDRGMRPVVIAPAPQVERLKQMGWELPYPVHAYPRRLFSLLHRVPSIGFALSDAYFGHLQRRYNFDVWHATMGYPIGVALSHFSQKRGGIPHLIRCAGDDIQREPEIGYGMRLDPRIDKLVREHLPKAQKLVAISESVADEYRALGVTEDKIAHVPNGVDLSRFVGELDRGAVRTKLGLDKDTFLFVAVGRNHPKKNYKTLIKAAAKLAHMTDRAFQVAIIGRGARDLSGEVSAAMSPPVYLFDEIGTEPSGGAVPDVPGNGLVELYKSADAFAFPSLTETFGIVIAEAMAAGLPVITSDAPGCRDLVRGGRDGIMVPPLDDTALAESMLKVLSDEQLRSDLSEKSLKRAKDFSWDSVVDRYVGLYQQLVGTEADK